jgi:hypothetical protein
VTDEEQRNEFAWNVHSYVNEYIRFADTKAELVIAWITAVLGALFAVKFHEKFGCSLVGILRIAGFSLLVLGFVCAFWVIRPRLKSTQIPGFIFWNSIRAHDSKDVFVDALQQQSSADLQRQVAGHLYDLSGVSQSKFRWVSISILFAFLGSMVSGLTYLFDAVRPGCH